MKFLWVIKLLDMIHDALCPFFRDREVEDLDFKKTKNKKKKKGSK